MSSAAASAAFAAFKGGSQPVSTNGTSGRSVSQKKPQLHIKLDANGSRLGYDNRSTPIQGSKPKPGAVPSQPLESPVFNIKGTRDDQISLASDHEYFYSNNNHSYSSHDFNAPESSRSRISVNTRPKDMLKLVRDSINSKSKTGFGKDSNNLGQMAINEFRNSLEQRRQLVKRNISPHNGGPVLLNIAHDELNILASSSASLENESENDTHPYRTRFSGSNSSLGGYESESRDQLLIPPVRIPGNDYGSDEDILRRKSPNALAASPIQIPPSPNALARGIATGNDSVPHLSILAGYLSSNSDAADQLEHKARLGRKPPPDLIEVVSSNEKEMWSMSDVSLNSDQDEFVGKPEISLEHEYRKLVLGPDTTVSKEDDLRQGRDPLPNGYPIFSKKALNPQLEQKLEVLGQTQYPIGHVNQVQPVKLKTTLRKMSKKKERKTLFNEDKPWKNHIDLDSISEQQRKRYEGLWVSNKGLYIDRVVTRLIGVNYDKELSQSKKSEDKKELSEKEISEYAAKLSSKVKYHVDIDENDVRELHGLDEAESHELIHAVVVKRIWKRSKLLNEVLAAIWDLVDYRRDGTLNKAEFLVGMWLVDQCLYGRKLPKTLSNSVWNSAGSVGHNLVPKKKRR